MSTYTVEQIRQAGIDGELNHYDVEHIISILSQSLSTKPVTEDEIEKMAEKEARFHFNPKYNKDAFTACKLNFIAGYKAAHQEKDGENCVASQSTTSEPLASHTSTVGNSIEQ